MRVLFRPNVLGLRIVRRCHCNRFLRMNPKVRHFRYDAQNRYEPNAAQNRNKRKNRDNPYRRKSSSSTPSWNRCYRSGSGIACAVNGTDPCRKVSVTARVRAVGHLDGIDRLLRAGKVFPNSRLSLALKQAKYCRPRRPSVGGSRVFAQPSRSREFARSVVQKPASHWGKPSGVA